MSHRNHVEARSNRIPATQYVSETHDHKPDAPGRGILVTEFGRFNRAAVITRAQHHHRNGPMEWGAALSRAYREASEELRLRFGRHTTIAASTRSPSTVLGAG